MLEEVVIPIDFGQGVDTKTDPKLVMASKFQLIKDGIFTNAKRVSKRNGYDNVSLSKVGGGSISNPKMIQNYLGELICASGGRLYSYSSTYAGWQDKGKYNSIKVSKSSVTGTIPDTDPSYPYSGPTGAAVNSSCVVIGNIALVAFDSSTDGYGLKSAVPSQFTYISVIDLSTGTRLVDSQLIAQSRGFSKAAILGSSTFAIFYMSGSAADSLRARIISVSLGSGVTVGSEVVIGTCKARSTLTEQFPYSYDYVTTSTGATLAVANQPNIDLYNINTSAATTATASIVSSGNIQPISINQGSNGNFWIYWGSANISLYYSIKTSALAAVLAATLIKTLPTVSSSQPTLSQVAPLIVSATSQVAYYTSFLQISAETMVNIFCNAYSATVNSVGTVGTSALFCTGTDIYSKIFTVGSSNYIPMVSLSTTGATGLLIDLSDALPVSKFLQEKAEGIYTSSYGTSGTTGTAASIIGIRYPGFIGLPQAISSTLALIPAGYVVSSKSRTPTSTTNRSVYPSDIVTNVFMGVALMSFDFNHIDANQSVIQQDLMVLNGGIVSLYDGSSVTELGFTSDPDNISVSTSASGGALTAGTYTYYITYEWTDAKGNLYASAPSTPINAFFDTGSANYASFIVLPPSITQKTNIIAKLWRSQDGGTIAYLVSTNGVDTTTYPFLTMADNNYSPTTVLVNPTLYTEGGAILDNISPPPSMILWINNNRVWCIDSENSETTIEYSKTASAGTGISFSTGLLELVIDSRYGSMTGAAPMDEKTVILKENGAGYFIGDGANDAGTGSTISNFQFVPSDVGCTNSKSVIVFPDGILFRTTKGIYILSRGLAVSYFGFPVEAYNSQDIQSAVIISNKNQIRFLTSSGYSLLFDYAMNQWSVFTNHTGYSATNSGVVYYYVRTDGSIYSENTTSFLDNTTSYSLILQTAWLALSSVQNFERVRELLPLGDYQNGSSALHGVQVQAAYDFSSTFGTAVPYYFGSASASGVFQYRNFFSRQKCNSISLLITELTNSVSGEYMDLTNMSFEAALKKGTNKLSQAKSVG